MNGLKTILLVEDNPNDVELTLEALAEHRVANEIVVLHDGAEALDYLYRRGRFAKRARGSPAVVLLDLKMPKVDGLTVLKTIKADPALKTIPIVMLTSSREERDVVDSYKVPWKAGEAVETLRVGRRRSVKPFNASSRERQSQRRSRSRGRKWA